MDPIDSSPDLELIAAFIDGRVSPEERARAVKLLADSDEALELYASALRHQADSPDVKVTPIATARRWRQWGGRGRVIVPVAAAAVLAIVAVPRLVARRGAPVSAGAYAVELTRNPAFTSGLPAGWEQREWSVTRGGGSSNEVGTVQVRTALESRLAFRLGVRSVDLQVALLRRDTVLAERLTNEVIETLKGVALSELVGARYTELKTQIAASGPARSIDGATAAERDLRDLLGASPFALGEWVGAADLAARTHDASFFQSSHGTGAVRSASPAGTLATEDIEALGAIDARVKKGLTGSAFDEVHDVLQSVIRRRGG